MSDGFLKEVAMPPKAAKQHAERAVPVGTNFLLGRAFYVTFCTTQKVTSRSLRRELRGFVNLEAVHINDKSTLTKLNPFETFEVFQTSIQLAAMAASLRQT